jgi:hypothetical protein
MYTLKSGCVCTVYVFEKADFVVTGCQPELRRLEEIDDID